jgi:Domain of unknown function (DUF4124)
MTIAFKPWLLGAALLLGASGKLCAGDVYKTVDADGHVTYSDHALSPNSKKITVDIVEGDPREAARLSDAMKAQNAEAAQRAKAAQQQAAEEQKQESQQQHQESACRAARARYRLFAAGGRLFHMDAQGNRVYYSDAEIDAQRDSAKAAMDAACPPE